MGFINKKPEKIYLDNSPEAIEARELMEALKQTEEFKKHVSLEKKALKTREAKEAGKLKKTAENSIDSKSGQEMQKIANEDTFPNKKKLPKKEKDKGFFNKFWKK